MKYLFSLKVFLNEGGISLRNSRTFYGRFAAEIEAMKDVLNESLEWYPEQFIKNSIAETDGRFY